MKKKIIYITREVPEFIVAPYRNYFDIRMWEKEDEPVPREVLLKEVQDVEGLLCLISEKIDQEVMDQAPNLKIISNMAVGYDHIDLVAAQEKGIIVTNTPDVLTETTADLAFALLMATARRIVEASNYIKENQWKHWSPYLLAGTDIHQKTIGIVGMGRIGEAVAKRARGFGMKIIYHNRNRKKEKEREIGASYRTFDNLLQEADFVVSVVPLTKETTHLFDERAFSLMKSSGIFINVSRGQVTDETALLNALKTGKIKAAGLDVFANEPIANNHPLLDLDQVLCIPHIGSASEETRTKMLELCMENLYETFYGNGPKTPVK